MSRLAQAPQGKASFVEDKRLAALTTALRSEGTLVYRKPDHLEKITTSPTPEDLVIDGNRLIIDAGGSQPPRVVELGSQPEVGALVQTIRAAVTGDLALLQRLYRIDLTGTDASWSAVLQPRDPALAKLVQSVRLTGGDALRSIESVAPNGDTDTLTITPSA